MLKKSTWLLAALFIAAVACKSEDKQSESKPAADKPTPAAAKKPTPAAKKPAAKPPAPTPADKPAAGELIDCDALLTAADFNGACTGRTWELAAGIGGSDDIGAMSKSCTRSFRASDGHMAQIGLFHVRASMAKELKDPKSNPMAKKIEDVQEVDKIGDMAQRYKKVSELTGTSLKLEYYKGGISAFVLVRGPAGGENQVSWECVNAVASKSAERMPAVEPLPDA